MRVAFFVYVTATDGSNAVKIMREFVGAKVGEFHTQFNQKLKARNAIYTERRTLRVQQIISY